MLDLGTHVYAPDTPPPPSPETLTPSLFIQSNFAILLHTDRVDILAGRSKHTEFPDECQSRLRDITQPASKRCLPLKDPSANRTTLWAHLPLHSYLCRASMHGASTRSISAFTSVAGDRLSTAPRASTTRARSRGYVYTHIKYR